MSSDVEHDEVQRMDTGPVRAAVLGRWVRIVLVTVFAVLVVAVILLFVPKTYEATATLLVEPRSSLMAAMEGQGEPPDPAASIAGQVEAIRSRELLLEVVDAKGLRAVREFSDSGISPFTFLMRLIGRGIETSLDETVIANLGDRLNVSGNLAASTISITVSSADPRLAADVANAVAAAHVKRRTAQWMTATADATVWLQQEIERLRGTVREAETAVADYKVERGLFVGAGATAVTDQQMSTVSDQIAAAQQRRNTALARSQVIRSLVESGQSLEGVADVQKSVVIQGLLETKANLQAELARRSTTLLANHPTIKALKAQIGELDRQIASEAGSVADSLAAEARVEADLEQRLREELTRAKLVAGDATKGGVTLDGLEREAKAQRDLLETYLARYSDIVSRGASNAAPPDIRIASDASVPAEPASPAFVPTLATVAFIVMALQVGAILLGEAQFAQPRTGRSEDEAGEQDEVMEQAVEAALFEDEMAVDEAAGDEPDLFADLGDGPPDDLLPVAEAAGLADPKKKAAMPRESFGTGASDDRLFPDDDMGALSAAVTTHQLRTVLLATVGDGTGSVAVVERLLEDTIMAELSAVVVDAGSGDVSSVPGLTDLAAGRADYGEVLQRAGENLAEVRWGRVETLDRHSSRPLTLIEALADIYHVVIVDTGRAGMASSLPLFTGARATVVLVVEDGASPVAVGQARRDVAALGFAVGRVVTLAALRADVA